MAAKLLWTSTLLAFGVAGIAGVEPPSAREERLKAAGVEATPEGVNKYLESQLNPPVEAEIVQLITDLRHEQFAIRERATQHLADLPFPPLEKLASAAQSSDLEQAMRAKRILAKIKEPRASALLAVLELVEEKKLAVDVTLLIKIHEKVAAGPVRQASFRALLAIVTKEDLPAVQEMLKSSDARVRTTGKWLVSRLEGGNAVPLLQGNVDAVAVTPGSVSGGGPNLIDGWEFKLKEAVTVTELGVYDSGKDGLKSAHEVAIWDCEDEKAPLVKATVPGGKEAELSGMFRCVSVEPVDLVPGRRYALVAHYPTPDDGNVGLTNPAGLTINYAAPVEVLGRRYTFPHKAMAFPNHFGEGATHAAIGPTFRFGELPAKK